MPSAAGIIVATGAMTLANDMLQGNQPLSTVADKVNWPVIPATAVAAAIFYGFEQVAPKPAKFLAALVFITAFTGSDAYFNRGFEGKTSPLGTLLALFNYPAKTPGPNPVPPHVFGGLPYV